MNDTCWAVDASAMVAESIKVFLVGQFWLDPEVFGPDQVAFARGMEVEHVNYRSWKRDTKRNVVADSDKHVIRVSIINPHVTVFVPYRNIAAGGRAVGCIPPPHRGSTA